MDDSLSQLTSLVLKKENTFTVSFQDFQEFFPMKWRNHDQVKILYEVIQERQNNAKTRVKENIEEFLTQLRGEEQIVGFDDLVRALTQLESYLRKDIHVLDSDITAVRDLIMQYISYLEVRSEEIFEESEAIGLADGDQKEHEFDSLISGIQFRS